MIIERRDEERARKILTGMIVSAPVLAHIDRCWGKEGNLFSSAWSNTLARLCVEFFRRFGDAPGREIEGLVRDWYEKNSGATADATAMEEILQGLSGDYEAAGEEIHARRTAEIADKYFEGVKLRRLAEGLQAKLNNGDLDAARDLEQNYCPTPGTGIRSSAPSDDGFFREGIAESGDPLIYPPAGFREFFGNALGEDQFVIFAGLEKRGKTWWLLTMIHWAILNHQRVFFFGAGDMTLNQVACRIAARYARRPLKEKLGVKIPLGVRIEDGLGELTGQEVRNFKGELGAEEARQAYIKFFRDRGRFKNDPFRLLCFPNGTLSVDLMKSTLEDDKRFRDFDPTVVVVDYADLLLPPKGRLEFRHQTDDLWKELRRFSQERKVLLITATQANSKAYKLDPIDRTCISEDKRKLAHVTAAYGLNQTSDEKDNGITRLNCFILREGDYSDRRCCAAAGSLAVANPAMHGYFDKDGSRKKDPEEEGGHRKNGRFNKVIGVGKEEKDED